MEINISSAGGSGLEEAQECKDSTFEWDADRWVIEPKGNDIDALIGLPTSHMGPSRRKSDTSDMTSTSVASSSPVTSRRGSSRRSSGTSAFSTFSTSPAQVRELWVDMAVAEEEVDLFVNTDAEVSLEELGSRILTTRGSNQPDLQIEADAASTASSTSPMTSRRSSGTSAFSTFSASLDFGLDEEPFTEDNLSEGPSRYNLFGGVNPGQHLNSDSNMVGASYEMSLHSSRTTDDDSRIGPNSVMSMLFGPISNSAVVEETSRERVESLDAHNITSSNDEYSSRRNKIESNTGHGPGNNLNDEQSYDASLVEELVCNECREILSEASKKSLKAVELANVLRARVGKSVLFAVRCEWGGLLSVLEKNSALFKVERIPKSDVVTLVGPEVENPSLSTTRRAQHFGEGIANYRGSARDLENGDGQRSVPIDGSGSGRFVERMRGKNYGGGSNRCDGYQQVLYHHHNHHSQHDRLRRQRHEQLFTHETKNEYKQKSKQKQKQKVVYSRRLKLENLRMDLSDIGLQEMLSKFGSVDSMNVVVQGQSKCAFVTYHQIVDAMKAMKFYAESDLVVTPVSVTTESINQNTSTTKYCPLLEILCDETYVPTRSWNIDPSRDHMIVNTIISLLQKVGGYLTISKLRGFLRSRLHSPRNINSIPLKALVIAYPKYFALNNNVVSFVGTDVRLNSRRSI